MKINPIADRVLIVQDPKTEINGLIVPDDVASRFVTGVIHAVGPGKPEYKMQLCPGQKIFFAPQAGTRLVVGDKTYVIMKEADIICTYDDAG